MKTAVPTLHVAKNGTTFEYHMDEQELARLDYEYNDKGKSIDLPDARRSQTLNEFLTETEDDDVAVELFAEQNDSCSPKAPEANEPFLLNAGCQPSKTLKRFAVKQEKRDVEPNQFGKRARGISRTTKSDIITVTMAKTYTKSSAYNNSDSTLQSCSRDDYSMDSTSTPNHTRSSVDESNNESISAANDNPVYIQMMSEQMKQIEELKRIIADKIPANPRNETNNGHGAQMTAAAATIAATPASVSGAQPIRVEKCPPMTKVQLFNGIRKYLNPSMVALLRMEMFGGSEREYRVDEKQFAKELYGLNENVYDYMRDEWRFRLPPKSDVANWLKDPDDQETWELC